MTEVDVKRLVIGFVLIFLLGILFALVNGWYTERTNEQLPFIVYGISFLSVILGAVIVLLFQWRINKAQVEKLFSLLPREERLVVQMLFDNGNKLEQNKLVALSSLSKVQVSRTVGRLEERGVVQKRRLGNTNLIMLRL